MRKLRRNEDVIWDEVDGATVFCHTRAGAFFRTNEVGRLIWETATGRSVEVVVESYLAKTNPLPNHRMTSHNGFARSTLVADNYIVTRRDSLARRLLGHGF